MDPFLDDDQGSSGDFDPMSLLRAFWRRKLLFLIPFILCLSMAGVVIKTMTPVYESSGQIVIKFNATNSRLLDDPSRRYGHPKYIDLMALQEMEMLLFSPEFLDLVVLELGLDKALNDATLPAPVAESAVPADERNVRRARNKLKSMIKLKEDGSRLFRIAVRDPNPEAAYRLASFIVHRFVEEYRASQLASSTSTREFLERQLSNFRTKLANAEKALTEFQASMASAALSDNMINAVNLATAEANLTAMRERYSGLDAEELANLARNVRGVLGSVPDIDPYRNDPIVRSTVSEMQDLGVQLRVFDEGDAGAIDLNNRLGQLRVRLDNRIEEMVSLNLPSLSFIELNQVRQYVYFAIFRTGVKHVMDELERRINQFRNFSSRRPGQAAELAELQADVTSARDVVATLEADITKQTMNLQANESEIGMQIRVREKPRRNYVPVEPNKMKLMALGGILSLGIGLGLVILAFLLDRSFSTVEDIERSLGLVVIGTLPSIQDEHFEQKKKLKLLRWTAIVLGILAVAAVGFLVVYPRLG